MLVVFSVINLLNNGMEPLESATLPYLTTENFVDFFPLKLFAEINNLSETNLLLHTNLLIEQLYPLIKQLLLHYLSMQLQLCYFSINISLNKFKRVIKAVSTCFNAAA